MNIVIDLPDESISGETAAWAVDFLYALGDAVATRYYGQIRLHYEDQRPYPAPLIFPQLTQCGLLLPCSIRVEHRLAR